MPAEARSVEVFSDIGAGRKPIGCKSVLVLHALNDMERLRKTPGCAGVIEVKMRKQHVRNACWIDTHARQFIDAALFFGHRGKGKVGNRTPIAVRVADAFNRVAAVDYYISFRMLNEKPGDWNFIRFV